MECISAINASSVNYARADADGVPAIAVTFNPHPVALLRPDKAPVPLVWPDREIALLKEAGATEVAVFRTGCWLLDLSAREFFDRVIRISLPRGAWSKGPNFAFGHDRQGNVEILGGWCAEAGIHSKSSSRSATMASSSRRPVFVSRFTGECRGGRGTSEPAAPDPGRCHPRCGAGLR